MVLSRFSIANYSGEIIWKFLLNSHVNILSIFLRIGASKAVGQLRCFWSVYLLNHAFSEHTTQKNIITKEGIWVLKIKKNECWNTSITVLDFPILQLTSQEEWPVPVNIQKVWRRKAEFRRPTGNQQKRKPTRHVRRRRNCPEVEGDLGRPQQTAPATPTALRMHIRRMTFKNQQRWS